MKTAAIRKKFKAVESFKSNLPIRMALRAEYNKYLSMNQLVKMAKQSEYKIFSAETNCKWTLLRGARLQFEQKVVLSYLNRLWLVFGSTQSVQNIVPCSRKFFSTRPYLKKSIVSEKPVFETHVFTASFAKVSIIKPS